MQLACKRHRSIAPHLFQDAGTVTRLFKRPGWSCNQDLPLRAQSGPALLGETAVPLPTTGSNPHNGGKRWGDQPFHKYCFCFPNIQNNLALIATAFNLRDSKGRKVLALDPSVPWSKYLVLRPVSHQLSWSNTWKDHWLREKERMRRSNH